MSDAQQKGPKTRFVADKEVANTVASLGRPRAEPDEVIWRAVVATAPANDYIKTMVAGAVGNLADIIRAMKDVESQLVMLRGDVILSRKESGPGPSPKPGRDPIADAHRSWLLVGQSGGGIDTSGFGIRAHRAVLASGCVTAPELAAYGRTRLLAIHGVGETSVNEIRTYLLEEHGLDLAP